MKPKSQFALNLKLECDGLVLRVLLQPSFSSGKMKLIAYHSNLARDKHFAAAIIATPGFKICGRKPWWHLDCLVKK
jgi:hypothetical protein